MATLTVTASTTAGTGATRVAAAFSGATYPLALLVTNQSTLYERSFSGVLFARGQARNALFADEASLVRLVNLAIDMARLNADPAGISFETPGSPPADTDIDLWAGTFPAPASDEAIQAAVGAESDASATWYDATANAIQLLKLVIAAFVGAGSHVYTYDASGNLETDAWTLFGTTRTKTYTWTDGELAAESDWVAS
jgi:hypothetical protein